MTISLIVSVALFHDNKIVCLFLYRFRFHHRHGQLQRRCRAASSRTGCCRGTYFFHNTRKFWNDFSDASPVFTDCFLLKISLNDILSFRNIPPSGVISSYTLNLKSSLNECVSKNELC